MMVKKVVRTINKNVIYLFLILSFLFYFSLTENTVIITVVLWPTVLLGAIAVVYRIINYKPYIKMPFIKLLVLFIISYVISMIVNIKYGFYLNFRTLIYMVFFFFIAYTDVVVWREHKEVKKMRKIAALYLILVDIVSSLSLAVFNCGFVVVNVFGVSRHFSGLLWARLMGFYNDYNYGAIFAAVGVVFALYFILDCLKKKCKNRKDKIVMILAIISSLINFAYIVLSDSRSGLLSLSCALLLYLIFIIIKKNEKPVRTLIIIVGIVAVVIGIRYGTKAIFKQIYYADLKNTQTEETLPNEISSEETGKKTDNIYDREYSSNIDISNRRFDLWKSGLEILKTTPVVGTSFENLVPYAQKNLPDTYLVNNDLSLFYNFHNIIFNVLVGQGIVGLVILLAFGVAVIAAFVKKMKRVHFKISNEIMAMVACVIVGACGMMFVGDIVYFFSPTSVILWMFLGSIMRYSFDNSEESVEK